MKCYLLCELHRRCAIEAAVVCSARARATVAAVSAKLPVDVFSVRCAHDCTHAHTQAHASADRICERDSYGLRCRVCFSASARCDAAPAVGLHLIILEKFPGAESGNASAFARARASSCVFVNTYTHTHTARIWNVCESPASTAHYIIIAEERHRSRSSMLGGQRAGRIDVSAADAAGCR